jgi:hypothetical protein
MEGAELDSPVLRNITIVDTPGNSVGSKTEELELRLRSGHEVVSAERADLIIIMFERTNSTFPTN